MHGFDLASVRDVVFEPGPSDDFQRWMSREVPAHIYALSGRVGYDDDLDGDGFSNGYEYLHAMDPFHFDAKLRVGYRSFGGESRLALEFDLPVGADLSTTAVGAYSVFAGEDEAIWRWSFLDDLEYWATSVEGERVQYRLPLSQFPGGPSLLFQVDSFSE